MASAPAAALLLLICLDGSLGEYSSQSLSTFVDTLLAEYDRAAPPEPRPAVALELDVRHAAVDDSTATMRLLADLTMKWNDSRVSWNASAWEGESVLVPAERLWTPEVALASAGSGGAGVALRARVAASGAVAAVRRLDLAAPLALQLRAWPRDEQRATFLFAATDYGDNEVELLIDDNTHSLVVESGAWQVVGVVGSVSRRGAAWSVRAARRGAAQAAAARAVLAAALLLLAGAAALPYARRPPLAAAATLLAAAWLTTAVFHVPAGDTTPRVLWEMCAACACGAWCGAGAACAAALARRTRTPPAALRALLSRVSALYALAPDSESACGGGAWAAAARLLDAVAVAALLLALLVLAAVHLFS